MSCQCTEKTVPALLREPHLQSDSPLEVDGLHGPEVHLQAEFRLGLNDALVLRHAEFVTQHLHSAQTPRHWQGLSVPQNQGTGFFPNNQRGLKAEQTEKRHQARK